MAVFIHPWEMMGRSKYAKYWLPWLVGMPVKQAEPFALSYFWWSA